LVFAPRDLRAGGTWLGLNADGVFVGLTNRSDGDRSGTRTSRGQLVLDALSQGSARAAALSATDDPSVYAGYHLIASDGEDAHLVYSDERAVVRQRLEPGVHVLTERSLGAADASREAWVREQMSRLAERAEAPSPEALAEVLKQRSTADAPFDRTIMDVPEVGYGTRASTLVFLRGDRSLFWHAEGPPDHTPYEDYTSQVLDILR
jgi:uncharacterized protein with NRDE domain